MLQDATSWSWCSSPLMLFIIDRVCIYFCWCCCCLVSCSEYFRTFRFRCVNTRCSLIFLAFICLSPLPLPPFQLFIEQTTSTDAQLFCMTTPHLKRNPEKAVATMFMSQHDTTSIRPQIRMIEYRHRINFTPIFNSIFKYDFDYDLTEKSSG